jgi:predicted enzyme related to lactoylglutathione lyase
VIYYLEMKSNFVVHFEIPVLDLDRAMAFYSAVFETSLTREEIDGYQMAMFPVEDEAFGASGALVQGDVYIPSTEGCFLYFGVESIDETMARALANGGAEMYAKKSNGDLGWVAEIKDTEGNRIALHQPAS